MAPIVASSQSKSKLRAFQYDSPNRANGGGPCLDDKEAEKENTNSLCDEAKAMPAQLVPRAQTLSQKSAGKENRECPQTPVGRLALAELIASGEDLNQHSFNLTPVERVLWNQSPRNSNPTNSAMLRKSRKRAQSSSPSSSAQNEKSNHFSTSKTTLNLQTLQKCLKTPKADPAQDLWSRYSVTNERRSPIEEVGPPFAHLLDSSSPQMPASYLRVKESGGLRRSLSCATEWPTSIAKRRKLEHRRTHDEADVSLALTEGADTGHSKSKRSRVSLLVDRLHNELAGTAKVDSNDVGGPSSSSPLPKKGRVSQVALGIASRSSHTEQYDRASSASHNGGDGDASAWPQPPKYPNGSIRLEYAKTVEPDSSSDFGDDDLDLEMLKAVDAGIEENSPATILENASRLDHEDGWPQQLFVATTPQPLECYNVRSIVPETDSDPNLRSKPLSEAARSQSVKLQSQTAIATRHDEFDEDDNDVSAADFEDAVAMYDLQPQAHTLERYQPSLSNANADQPKGIGSVTGSCYIAAKARSDNVEAKVVELSSDDEFGGAMDFEQIIAECVEASQEPQVAPQSSVCTNYFGQSR